MSSSGKGDANSYWPGFVDALTNVVIAMIFVVVVLAIALSFAAQLMGKKIAEQYIKQHEASLVKSKPPDAPPLPAPDSALPRQRHIAVAGNERAASASAMKTTVSRNRLQLDYAPGALTLDAAAMQQLKAAITELGPDGPRRRVQLLARGAEMSLSENQRAAYLRVMAVRNALLDAGFPADHLTMTIDTQADVASPVLDVSFSELP